MSLSEMMQTLPMNRKEVFFSATVLPGIICCNDFAHFSLFLKLIELHDLAIGVSPEAENIQFYTEYSITEALAPRTIRDKYRAPDFKSKETPDVLIRIIHGGKTTIIAIEAKMFSSINPKRLQIQLKDQREKVLRYLEQTYGANVIHIALLPNQLIERWKKLGTDSLTFTEFKAGAVHLVTWEAILAPYKERGLANYWTSNLELALQDFCTLASRFVWDANSDGDFTGAEIVMRYEAEDFPYKMMGCRGGLDGTTLSAEIESGHWKTRSYSGKREQQAANQLAFYKRLHPKDC